MLGLIQVLQRWIVLSKQHQLFDTEPEPWQLDDQDDWLAARIVFAEAPYGPYDYRVPPELEQALQPGSRVEVPLGRGNRKIRGWCVEIIGPGHPGAGEVAPGRLKPVQRVIDDSPLLSSRLLELSKWIAEYYICPLGNVIETVVPTGVRDDSGTREVLFLGLAADRHGQLDEIRLPAKQQAVVDVLRQGAGDWTPRELAETVGCTLGPINALRKKGIVVASSRRIRNISHQVPIEQRTGNLNLNQQQQAALERIEQQIDDAHHRTFVMHGITGSGKTEVYIRAIQKVVGFGRQAIVLVPEISKPHNYYVCNLF